jgi:hypothetical protein|tara:strand:+ start:4251 stop:4856 length:606 start_codon:yes stop_codon:yes gene_type:complete
MADMQTELQKIQGKMGRPLPGQSLTNDPENPAPFEQAPEYTTVNEGVEFLWDKFIEPETYTSVLEAIADGTPIMNLVQVVLYDGFTKGKWNPDLMMMLAEPATYMLMALAERQDIPMTIYDGELEDETDDEMLFGQTLTDDRINQLKSSKESGTIPAGILTPEMEEELESLPEVKESLMSRPETPAANTESLMAAPVGEEV